MAPQSCDVFGLGGRVHSEDLGRAPVPECSLIKLMGYRVESHVALAEESLQAF